MTDFDRIPTSTGRLHLCALRDVAGDPDGALASVGASTMVCLVERTELERRHPAYLEWLIREAAGRAIWFPIRNYGARDVDYVMPIVRRIVERLDGGVLMHCNFGQGRAGTMAAAVLMALGADQDAAVKTVAANRMFAGPVGSRQWDLLDAISREL